MAKIALHIRNRSSSASTTTKFATQRETLEIHIFRNNFVWHATALGRLRLGRENKHKYAKLLCFSGMSRKFSVNSKVEMFCVDVELFLFTELRIHAVCTRSFQLLMKFWNLNDTKFHFYALRTLLPFHLFMG